MYRLLAHLADPSGWSAADIDRPAEMRSRPTSGTHGPAAASLLSTREHGSLFRAPPPQLHETR